MSPISAYVYVRMSTELQTKGDSLRRQTDRAERYAQQHNLMLQTKRYEDLGVSAFRGQNVEEGALGAFIKEVDEGRIARGSYLLVESLDRLSRATLLKAFELFARLINSGITIVTLLDGQKYEQKSVDMPSMMLSLSIMMRAHDESMTKSSRGISNWEKKRSDMGHTKMTKTCPHWLSLAADRKSFIVDADRAKLVNKIFMDAINGMGVSLIAKRLNIEGVEAWGRTKGWRDSYIKKVLSGEAVRGHIVVHEWVNGLRLARVQEDYYPRIVSEDIYLRAQEALKSRRGKGGRKGKQIANLFSGIAKCGYCGSAMHLKDGGIKNGKYLICDKGRRGMGCITNGYPYSSFENTFLKVIKDVDLAELFLGEERESVLNEIEKKISIRSAQTSDLTNKLETLADALEKSGVNSEFVIRRMASYEDQLNQARQELKTLQVEQSVEAARVGATRHDQVEVSNSIDAMNSLRGDERLVLRAKVQQRILSLVSQIDVYSIGRDRSLGESTYIKKYMAHLDKEGMFPASGTEWIISNTTKNYLVTFKSGRQFIVIPTQNDPSGVEMYIDTFDLEFES